jgi:hypothetical protein
VLLSTAIENASLRSKSRKNVTLNAERAISALTEEI